MCACEVLSPDPTTACTAPAAPACTAPAAPACTAPAAPARCEASTSGEVSGPLLRDSLAALPAPFDPLEPCTACGGLASCGGPPDTCGPCCTAVSSWSWSAPFPAGSVVPWAGYGSGVGTPRELRAGCAIVSLYCESSSANPATLSSCMSRPRARLKAASAPAGPLKRGLFGTPPPLVPLVSCYTAACSVLSISSE